MLKDIADSFQDYFEMLPATTEELRQAAYRLRYQVFCIDLNYWDAKLFPDGLEKDKYDDHAEHYLIRHRETGIFAATTRLILPHVENPGRPFPIETHSTIETANLLDGVPRNQLAEVSRFCVSAQYKRRLGEKNTLAGGNPQEVHWNRIDDDHERRTLPYFMLSLIACLIRMSIYHGITHWFAFMEPAFARVLRSMGILFIPVGPELDYCGKRRPYLIKVTDLLSGTKEKNLVVWNIVTNHGAFWDDGNYAQWAGNQVDASPAEADGSARSTRDDSKPVLPSS